MHLCKKRTYRVPLIRLIYKFEVNIKKNVWLIACHQEQSPLMNIWLSSIKTPFFRVFKRAVPSIWRERIPARRELYNARLKVPNIGIFVFECSLQANATGRKEPLSVIVPKRIIPRWIFRILFCIIASLFLKIHISVKLYYGRLTFNRVLEQIYSKVIFYYNCDYFCSTIEIS